MTVRTGAATLGGRLMLRHVGMSRSAEAAPRPHADLQPERSVAPSSRHASSEALGLAARRDALHLALISSPTIFALHMAPSPLLDARRRRSPLGLGGPSRQSRPSR